MNYSNGGFGGRPMVTRKGYVRERRDREELGCLGTGWVQVSRTNG